MKLSRERKVFVIICALALAALVVDRTMLSEASGGDAAAGDPSALLVTGAGDGQGASAGSARGASTSPNRAGQPTPSAAAISEMLAQMGERNRRLLEHTPDAFQPGAAWSVPDLAHPAEPVTDVRVETFAKRKLTSLVAGGRGKGGAMVDGQMVHVGQSLDGFVLVSVDGQSALFEGRAVRVRLSLTGEPRVSSARPGETLSGR